MARHKRPASFFEAETRVIEIDTTLVALAEETRLEFEAEASLQRIQAIEIAEAHTLLCESDDLAIGSEHGDTAFDPIVGEIESFSRVMTAQRPALSREHARPTETRVALTRAPSRAVPQPFPQRPSGATTAALPRFATGSNPPAPREGAVDLERTMRREPPRASSFGDDEKTFCRDHYPSFEAAPGAVERTELRPTTMPSGPYCAVGAPQLAAYQITRQIASGGMGIVYEAFHRTSNKRVAVKYMREESAQKAALVKRFLGEGVAASRIDHPGITDIYDYGHDKDGVPYLVMEFLDGESLGTRLTRGALHSCEFFAISRQLVEILEVAHTHGIVHRDLKPDNIFLVAGPTTHVKLLDFGVAKFLDDEHLLSRTSTGQILGTPFYMSPEQCAGQKVDHRSDIYSLGCVLYQMLAGKVPFAGNIFDVVHGHRQKRPIPLDSLTRDLPVALISLIDELMEKDPADRPRAMSEIGERIESIASGKSAEHSKPTTRRKKKGNVELASRPRLLRADPTRSPTRRHRISEPPHPAARYVPLALAAAALAFAMTISTMFLL